MKVPAHTLVPLPDELSFATGRGDFMRHRHRLSSASAHEGDGRRYHRHRRSRARRLVGDATRRSDGVRVSSHSMSAPSGLRARKSSAADALIDPKADNPVAAIKALTHGAGADMTLDTSGAPDGRLIAVRGTRPWGTACFVGEGSNVTLDVSPDMLRKQLTIIRILDFFDRRTGGLRALRCGSQNRCRPFVHASLGACAKPKRPTVCSTSRRAAKACFWRTEGFEIRNFGDGSDR